MARVREQARALETASGVEEERLLQQLHLNVAEVEQSLEFLLAETPELTEKVPACPSSVPADP